MDHYCERTRVLQYIHTFRNILQFPSKSGKLVISGPDIFLSFYICFSVFLHMLLWFWCVACYQVHVFSFKFSLLNSIHSAWIVVNCEFDIEERVNILKLARQPTTQYVIMPLRKILIIEFEIAQVDVFAQIDVILGIYDV